MTRKIIIIDSQSANISSVKNALHFLGFEAKVSKDCREIEQSSHMILPGVGTFDTCIKALDDANLRNVIIEKIGRKKTPFLGICVGMQVLFDKSDEGSLLGLGIINGSCVELKIGQGRVFKVPHNGFAEVIFSEASILNHGLRTKEYFYFNHSYAVHSIKETKIIDLANHSSSFVASFQYRNIFGVQFHPEKSQKAGLKLLTNFLNFNSV